MGCDYFVTPVAADLFSLYALENIGEWFRSWLREYQTNYARLVEKEADLSAFDIPAVPPVGRGWAGYSVQQYVTKTTGGRMRQIEAYDRYRREIPKKASLLDALQVPGLKSKDLGIVPNMFSMVPLAQAAHAPVADLSLQDGLRGAQVGQRDRYAEKLEDMFDKLTENLGL